MTVVGGHATVGRLSNNVFWTFQAIRIFFEKSRWTVTRQWSEVTRPSADCQTTFFGRFQRFGKILKKVADRSRDSGWGHATVGRLSNNVFWTFQAIWENFEKSHWRSRDSGRRSRDRWMTVKQRFFDVSNNSESFWKKSLNGHATVVGGHATVGWLSNNVFWTFQTIWKVFEKSHWTVTRQWSEVTRPSADCQTTFFGRFKQFEIFFEKSHWTVTRQWSEVTRPSADCQAHICMNKRERERERETISVTLHTGTAILCRWPFHQPASRLRLALTRVVDRQGQLVCEYCKSSHWQVEFMLCAICRSTFTRQFSRVLTPGPSSLDFSRESPAKDMWCYVAYVYNGELVSLIGNQWVGFFPPKSKILFVLSLALKWCRNFQDGTIPVGGDTWTSCSAERRYNKKNNKNNKNKETSRSGLLLLVEYLRNGKRYSSFVFTVAKRKSHATKRCNPRFCSCYRFWDIVVANIKNFQIFHFDENLLERIHICRRTSSYGIIKKYRVQGYVLPVEYLRNGER